MLSVLKGAGHYPLGGVEPFMMSDMIVKPAHCAGLTVSDRLARRIVNDTLAFRNLESSDSDTANLPLLAFVLDQLFLNRSDHTLSDEAYNAMGGISGAIEEHVKTVEKELRQLGGAKANDHLAKIFHSLVIVKEEGLPTRNRPLLADFPLELRPSVKVLVDARLLRTEGEGERSTVSVSHEKLFEAWPALREYVSANKKALMDQTLLNSRARKWADMGKPWFSGLASRREEKDFRSGGVPTPLAKDYLTASARARWMTGSAAGLLSVIAFVSFYFAKQYWREGLATAQVLLRLRSYVMSIHLEPDKDQMVIVSAGSFRMVGRDDQPVRDVKFQKAFKLSKYEVTFDEYDRFALATGRKLPSDVGWGRGRRPVINVSWEEAEAYAKWLSDQTRKSYRLPTEAEWEYAARSGGKDEIWAGTSDQKQLPEYAVFGKTTGTEPVGSKKPNGKWPS